jgi:hypothetical protein
VAVLFGVFLVGPQPLWAGQPSGPPAGGSSFEPIGWAGVILTLVFVLAMCLPFRPYLLALRAVSQARVPRLWLIGLTAVVALVALLIYPAFGSDIFDYVGFERMWAIYGDNPLLALPANHLQDWSTAFVWYPDRTPAYGPLWAIVTWPIVVLAGNSPMAAVLGYKLLSTLAYVACCWLVWASVEPGRRQQALIMFAWSPLVLFEVLGKVHNDILPTLAMLGGVWLVTRPSATGLKASLAAGMAGGLVKITALAAAPPIGVYLWRRGRRTAVMATALALLVCIALYAPFWMGLQTFDSIWNQASRQVWSPTSVLMLVGDWLPGGASPMLVRVLLGSLCGGVCAWLIWRRRPEGAADLAASSGWVLLASLLLLSSAVFAHYLVPAVALAAVSNDRRLQRVVMWLSIGGLAAYGVELLGLSVGPGWPGSDGYRVLGTLTLLGPACAMLVARAPGRWPPSARLRSFRLRQERSRSDRLQTSPRPEPS